MNEGFEWRMFPPTNASEHLRIHYLYPNGSTSAGFVEQRQKGKAGLRVVVEYYVTSNDGSDRIFEQPVATLAEGMNIIEWLVRERKVELNA
jgi:hypothetical protein